MKQSKTSTPKRFKYHTEEERLAARAASKKKYEDKNRGNDKKRATHLKRRYGLTLQQWNDKFYQQGCCCDICGVHDLDYSGNWDTDHCHDTGKVRGILCHPCNTILTEHATPAVLSKAIDYLKAHNG